MFFSWRASLFTERRLTRYVWHTDSVPVVLKLLTASVKQFTARKIRAAIMDRNLLNRV